MPAHRSPILDDRFLERLRTATEKRSIAPRAANDLFREFLSVAGVAGPDEPLWEYFARLDLVVDLAQNLVVIARSRADEPVLRLGSGTLSFAFGRRTEPYYQVRGLGPEGSYPHRSFGVRNASYVLHGGTPYLVTSNSPTADRAWGDVSEMFSWTRQETRMATTLACCERRSATPYMTATTSQLRVRQADHVPADLRPQFLANYFELQQRMRGTRTLAPPVEHFFDFTEEEPAARRYAHGFVISNPLLLKTGRTYVTAVMQWATESFREEAFGNVLISLEGCLMLLQEIYGGKKGRLDRKFLREVFIENFLLGDGIFDWIEDAMGWGGTRAQLVHPHLANDVGWKPLYFADDYYDYVKTVRALLGFIVANARHPDYDPPPTRNPSAAPGRAA